MGARMGYAHAQLEDILPVPEKVVADWPRRVNDMGNRKRRVKRTYFWQHMNMFDVFIILHDEPQFQMERLTTICSF